METDGSRRGLINCESLCRPVETSLRRPNLSVVYKKRGRDVDTGGLPVVAGAPDARKFQERYSK